MSQSLAVRVTSFGEGRFEHTLKSDRETVSQLLDGLGIAGDSRRIAINGHRASPNTVVVEGDEVTVTPRVQGG